jgi:hypothetical protein
VSLLRKEEEKRFVLRKMKSSSEHFMSTLKYLEKESPHDPSCLSLTPGTNCLPGSGTVTTPVALLFVMQPEREPRSPLGFWKKISNSGQMAERSASSEPLSGADLLRRELKQESSRVESCGL